MAGFEVNAQSTVCRRCGKAYGNIKLNYYVSYGALYKGTGYLPYCKGCVNDMYLDYLERSEGNARMASRQLCRKLDIYWSDDIFDAVEHMDTERGIFLCYLKKTNLPKYAGKSYDTTLEEEKTTWIWVGSGSSVETNHKTRTYIAEGMSDGSTVPDEVRAFWGPGYSDEMYMELEQRLQYYKSKMPEVEMGMGAEALLRQIAMAEIDINKARAEGKPVDKMVNSLNTLLGSAMLKPAQKSEDTDDQMAKTPFGVWIKLWEDKRPTPEISEDLKDVDGITHYVLVWFYGHLCHMLGIKNAYSKLYEDEINRLKVERPEYEEEDEESMLYNIFGDAENEQER